MKAHLIGVSKIWDQAPHNAFTDLTHFNNQWFCTFREASTHMSEDGKLRVIRSTDGVNWESAALFSSTEERRPDLRDPKIVVGPDGQLVLMGTGTSRDINAGRNTYLWFSHNGTDWSEGCPAREEAAWLWSLACDKAACYSAGYSGVGNSTPSVVSLYKKEGSSNFKPITTLYTDDQYPNETSLLFHNDEALAIIRREFAPGQTSMPPYNNGTALLATSKAPFTEWHATDLGIYVGGPILLRLPNGKIIASGRKITSNHYTALWEVDVEKRQLKELLLLPSGGDCAYPGLEWHDDRLWVSYYSHHERKSCIYFAEVQLESVVTRGV